MFQRYLIAGIAFLATIVNATPSSALPSAIIDIPATSPMIPTLLCSTTYGCEVDTPPNQSLVAVTVTDPRFAAQVLSVGGAIGARIKILPTTATISTGENTVLLQGELDILTNAREYHVKLIATTAFEPHILQYRNPQPLVLMTPPPAADANDTQNNHTLETTRIPVNDLDFAWYTTGSNTCVTLFSLNDRGQIWCRLNPRITSSPVAYISHGRTTIPVNMQMTRSGFAIIDSLASTVTLYFVNGDKTIIHRGYKQQ